MYNHMKNLKFEKLNISKTIGSQTYVSQGF